MPDHPTIHEALSAVMGDVQAVGKTGRNQQQNYNFRGVDAVVNAVGPALRDHGVIVMPEQQSIEYRPYATKSGTQMMGCTVHVRYTFHGPAGDSLSCSVTGESSDSGDKATPKAFSVAYRTALLQALCIPTDEPDPDQTSHERATPAAPEPVINKADADRIAGLLNADTPETRKAWVTRFGGPPASLPVSRLAEANDWLSDLDAAAGGEG